jgi:basic amino acid/polyamine antiporter, APA family
VESAGGKARPVGPAPRVADAGAEPTGPLRRGISRRVLLVFIVGDILGGGIYALVGEVGGEVGGAIWTAFLLALALAAFTAAAYAELATKYPRAGGAAYYVNRAFGLRLLTFLVTFAVMASGISSASTLARAFGGDYLSAFVALPTLLVALVFIVLVALVNYRGIVESVRLNVAFTAIEVLGLLLIVVIGVVALVSGDGEPGRALEFKPGLSVPALILAGAALSFYALIGFEDSVNVAEEVKEPWRAYPFALFGGLAVAGVLYLLVTFTASMVVPTERLAGSSSPLLEVIQVGPLSGVPDRLFSAIALFALANGALINMIMASRILYGRARERILPGAFGRVGERRHTPWFAIVFTTVLAMIAIATGDTESLASATVTLLLFAFILVNVAVLVLRRDRVEHDHFTVPRALPVLGAVVSIALLTQQAGEDFLRAGAFLVIGVLLWLVNRLAGGERGGPPPDAPTAAQSAS